MTFETKIDVRYPDCDSMGIVHHAVYPIWYEIARMDFFARRGYSYEYTHARGIDPAMVHLELDYGAPVSYPASVSVRITPTLCEGKKLAFRYEVWTEGASKPNASASSLHIWVKDGKSYSLEQELPEMFAALRAGID